MPVERLTPERRRELTRAALIDAAAELFAQRGFHATSLEEIAESAGFTRGAIYSNFKNKEDLLLAVIERYNELNLQSFTEALGRVDPRHLDDQLAVAAALWREVLRRDPNLTPLSLELHLHALRNPEFRRRLNENFAIQRANTAQLIEIRARETGYELTVPAADLADILWAATSGFLEYAALDESPERWDHLVELFFRMVDEALRGPAWSRKRP